MSDSLPILYHGTDARIIQMSEEERSAFKYDCMSIIDSLWPFYKPLLATEIVPCDIPGQPIGCTTVKFKIQRYESLFNRNDFYNLMEKMTMVEAMKSGSGLCQYGSLYLTTEKRTAANYAWRSFAFGEIGLIAYRLLNGATTIGFSDWHPDDKVVESIDRFQSFSSNEQSYCPVVIKIKNYDINFLANENGEPLDDYMDILGHFRYLGELSLDLKDAVYLKSANFAEWWKK